VSGKLASDPNPIPPGFAVAPGGGPMPDSFREGDYSSIAVDPSDGLTFWATNEYIGADGSSDIWRTHIASFTVVPPVAEDCFSVTLPTGNEIILTTSTPADGPGEFNNTLDPHIELYDSGGNLVASGTVLPDGRNEQIDFTAPAGGVFFVRVVNDNGTQGE